MRPAPFELFDPDTEEEILGLLAEHGEDARVLAGGQSLVPLLNMRIFQPRVLVSLGRCAALARLDAIDGEIVCGAMARQADVLGSPEVARASPLLGAALARVGVPASRSFGTVCGSLAHADPGAELPAAATALGARMVIGSARGTREVEAAAFYEGPLSTCMEPDEMLCAVRVPAARPGERHAFLEVGNRAHGLAVIGLAALVEVEGEVCRTARLAALGLGTPGLRLEAAEDAVRGQALGPALAAEAAGAARAEVDPPGDLHASAGARRHLIGVLVRRALEQIAAAATEARA